jgi:hypothetical protein
MGDLADLALKSSLLFPVRISFPWEALLMENLEGEGLE